MFKNTSIGIGDIAALLLAMHTFVLMTFSTPTSAHRERRLRWACNIWIGLAVVAGVSWLLNPFIAPYIGERILSDTYAPMLSVCIGSVMLLIAFGVWWWLRPERIGK